MEELFSFTTQNKACMYSWQSSGRHKKRFLKQTANKKKIIFGG